MKKYAVTLKNDFGYNTIIIDDASSKAEAVDLAEMRYSYCGVVAGVALLKI